MGTWMTRRAAAVCLSVGALGTAAACAGADSKGNAPVPEQGNPDGGAPKANGAPDTGAPPPNVGPDGAVDPTGVAPLLVDDVFIAAGYMGDGEKAGGITDEESCASPRFGEGKGKCHKFTWTPGAAGWGGVWWQFPAENW